MSDYHNSFRDRDENAAKQAVGFFTVCDPKLSHLFEETIGFQDYIARNLKSVKDDHGYDNLAMCYNRCMFNTSHLYSAYQILKSDDLPMFLAMIRVVFESFPKLFYCMRRAEKAKHVFCCEEFLYGEMMESQDEGIRRFCKSVQEPINCEKCKYVKCPNWFREKVYTKSRQKSINKRYGQYSVNVHPSFTPAYVPTREYLDYGWKTGLGILTDLSLMNAFIMVNAVKRGLTARGEYEFSKQFIEDIMREAGDDLRSSMVQMYPNRIEYTEMLPFALPDGLSD